MNKKNSSNEHKNSSNELENSSNEIVQIKKNSLNEIRKKYFK